MEVEQELDRLGKLYKLFLRYEKRAIKGVQDGHLFFSADQIIEFAGKMARWHLETEDREAERR
jgi:hypothetical protein